MNDPTLTTPIPTPDGQILENSPFDAAEIFARPWKEAPYVVRGGAFASSLLYGLVFALILVIGFIPTGSADQTALPLLIGGAGLALVIMQRRGLKNHSQTAWKAQIVLSAIGLFAFPIGTFLSFYILLEWFKPETKAWFGK